MITSRHKKVALEKKRKKYVYSSLSADPYGLKACTVFNFQGWSLYGSGHYKLYHGSVMYFKWFLQEIDKDKNLFEDMVIFWVDDISLFMVSHLN